MEVVEPRIVWILTLGYEVTLDKIIGLANILLKSPKETIHERFKIYEDKSTKVHMEQREPQIKKNVEQIIAQFAKAMGLTKDQVK